MKVLYLDDKTPRSDGRKGKPSGITINNVYEVIEILDDTGQYTILNDRDKLTRHSQHRFEIVDYTPIRPLRLAFNSLTTSLRKEIKRLNEVIESISHVED